MQSSWFSSAGTFVCLYFYNCILYFVLVRVLVLYFYLKDVAVIALTLLLYMMSFAAGLLLMGISLCGFLSDNNFN